MKWIVMTLAPFAFVAASCGEWSGTLGVDIECPLPLPIITDTTATGTFNAACPYYIQENDSTLKLVTPGT